MLLCDACQTDVEANGSSQGQRVDLMVAGALGRSTYLFCRKCGTAVLVAIDQHLEMPVTDSSKKAERNVQLTIGSKLLRLGFTKTGRTVTFNLAEVAQLLKENPDQVFRLVYEWDKEALQELAEAILVADPSAVRRHWTW